MRCPKDQVELHSEGGKLACGQCGGALYDRAELDAEFPRFAELLILETNLASGAFGSTVQCPSCSGVMAPWHLEHAHTWIEVCAGCERYWLDRPDRSNAKERSKLAARQAAVASMSAGDRKELATVLAESERGEGVPISALHRALALVGFPVVTRQVRVRSPLATWGLAALLLLLYVFDRSTGGSAFETWSYRAGAVDPLSLVTASFVHAGWMHLIGNLYFLIAFGDGVEQRISRPSLIAAFVFGGAFAILFESLFQDPSVLIGGASAGVAVLMGMCVRLQRTAQVTTTIAFTYVVRISILSYAAIELGYQTFMALFGSSSVAWLAHASGLVLGLGLGEVASRLWPQA